LHFRSPLTLVDCICAGSIARDHNSVS
jgi:hypothetical protein